MVSKAAPDSSRDDGTGLGLATLDQSGLANRGPPDDEGANTDEVVAAPDVGEVVCLVEVPLGPSRLGDPWPAGAVKDWVFEPATPSDVVPDPAPSTADKPRAGPVEATRSGTRALGALPGARVDDGLPEEVVALAGRAGSKAATIPTTTTATGDQRCR